MDDRRTSSRSRTLLEGHIIVPGRPKHLGCTVLDLSDAGARVLLDWDAPLPPEFEIRIPRRRVSRCVRAVWSKGRNRGLMFTDGTMRDHPQEVSNPDAVPAETADEVGKVLEQARFRLATILGKSADRVRLRVEIDY